MPLQPEYLFYVVIFLTLIILSVSVGVRVLMKYFELRKKEFIYVGICAILISEPAWPVVINNFMYFLGFQEGLSILILAIIGYIGMPLAFLMWLFAVADLIYIKHQTIIRVISIIIATSYQILFIIYVFNLPDSSNDIFFNFIINLYSGVMALILLITALSFAKKCSKSSDPRIRLKGKFILIV